jgi:hypothetical protein
LDERLVVCPINDEELIRDKEHVASLLVPAGGALEERANDVSIDDVELIDYEQPVAPQDN